METRINKDLVSHVEIKDGYKGYEFFKEIREFTWLDKEYTSFFGLFKQVLYEDGFYLKGSKRHSFSWRLSSLPDGCYDLNGELYSFASVSIFYGEKRIKTMYFNTVEECRKWCRDNLPNVNLILK